MLTNDVLYEIMIYLDDDDLYKFCNTNKKLCQNEYFWERKINHDGFIKPSVKVDWLKYYPLLKIVNDDVNSMYDIKEYNVHEHEYRANTNNTADFVKILNFLNIKNDLPIVNDDRNVEFGAWYSKNAYTVEFMLRDEDVFIEFDKIQYVNFLFQLYYNNIIKRIA